jgi:hypothetical protein
MRAGERERESMRVRQQERKRIMKEKCRVKQERTEEEKSVICFSNGATFFSLLAAHIKCTLHLSTCIMRIWSSITVFVTVLFCTYLSTSLDTVFSFVFACCLCVSVMWRSTLSIIQPIVFFRFFIHFNWQTTLERQYQPIVSRWQWTICYEMILTKRHVKAWESEKKRHIDRQIDVEKALKIRLGFVFISWLSSSIVSKQELFIDRRSSRKNESLLSRWKRKVIVRLFCLIRFTYSYVCSLSLCLSYILSTDIRRLIAFWLNNTNDTTVVHLTKYLESSKERQRRKKTRYKTTNIGDTISVFGRVDYLAHRS